MDLAKYINSIGSLDVDENGIELDPEFVTGASKLLGYSEDLIQSIYSIGSCTVFPHIDTLFSCDINQSMKTLGYTDWNEKTLIALTSLPRLTLPDLPAWWAFDEHYAEINAYLRSGGTCQPNYDQIISDFRNILKPKPDDTPIILYRGISFDPDWAEGEIITTQHFWHTSIDPGVAKKFCLDVKLGFDSAKPVSESAFITLTVKSKVKMLWLKMFDYSTGEKEISRIGGINEVILADRVQFKVLQVRKRAVTSYDLESC